MKLIKIINGTYGFRPQPNVVERKTADDAPFFVEDREADRLVRLGVAAIAGEKPEAPAPLQAPASEHKPAGVYSERMKLSELKDAARAAGAAEIDLKDLRSKKEVIALICELTEEDAETGGDREEAPRIAAADPV